jgi:hypothetical protein
MGNPRVVATILEGRKERGREGGSEHGHLHVIERSD